MTKKTEKLESDGTGNRFLPGTEPESDIISALHYAVRAFKNQVEPNYKSAKKEYDGYKKLLADLTVHYKGDFQVNERGHVYNDGMVEVVVAENGKVTYSIIDDSRKEK